LRSTVDRPRAAWDQQLGENDLWYARFLRFVALGPGRSVSLVATGRRNAYPVPAHWPIQAKQRSWRERASAFDAAIVAALKARNTIEDRIELVELLNNRLMALASTATNGESAFLEATLSTGGYQLPSDDDEDEDEDDDDK
jgi:hypothetical protein